MERFWRVLTWENIIRAAALIGIANEAMGGVERPSLLILYAAMLGLPEALLIDRQRQKKNGNGAHG